jgi:hypothetical protein
LIDSSSAQWKNRRNFPDQLTGEEFANAAGGRRGEGSMAVRNRRYALASIVLPVLFLAMAGLARANTIIVNTLDSGTQPFPLCTLEDAVLAADTQLPQGGCPAGAGNFDTIEFIVTGTIFPDKTLTINNTSEDLIIEGPTFGGITINGLFNMELVDAEGTLLTLENLTLAQGNSAGGGAVFANDSEIGIVDCSLVNNEALEGGAVFGTDSLIFFLNDTFAGNQAFAGGGIFNATSELLVSNSTFSANAALGVGDGADIATDTGATFANSTIFANSLSGGNCAGVGDGGYNISDDNSCGFSGTSVNNSTTLKLDPLGLQNNGGPTQTVALESGSLAIDFVPIASCDDGFDDPVTNDQRLFTRPDPGNLNFCDAGAYESGAVAPIVLAPKSERLQIARSTAANSDKVNTAFTFIYNGDPDCDIATGGDEDALNSGIGVALFEGTCANIPASGLILYLDPFQVRTVNHKQYGMLFQSFGPETVSARMVALPTPAGACGAWTLNLEVAGLNTGALGLTGSNPFALLISDFVEAEACFDINNAIVGNQIPKPAPGVRRGVKR